MAYLEANKEFVAARYDLHKISAQIDTLNATLQGKVKTFTQAQPEYAQIETLKQQHTAQRAVVQTKYEAMEQESEKPGVE